MKKVISALLIPVICLCLVACSSSDTEAQAYAGVWTTNELAFNLDGDTWNEVSAITLKENGTAIFKGEIGTWEHNENYGKYGTIHIALSRGGTVVLNIEEENGKTVLKHTFNSYYRQN